MDPVVSRAAARFVLEDRSELWYGRGTGMPNWSRVVCPPLMPTMFSSRPTASLRPRLLT